MLANKELVHVGENLFPVRTIDDRRQTMVYRLSSGEPATNVRQAILVGFQLAYEVGRAGDTLLGGKVLDLVNQRAGDDRAIGVRANLLDMRRAADPKAHYQRQIGEAAHAIEEIGQSVP